MSIRSTPRLALGAAALLAALFALQACCGTSSPPAEEEPKPKAEKPSKADEADKDDDEEEVDACAGNFKSMGKSSFTCRCESDQITGSVWGTDIYTSDSSICAAARHVGAIGKTGGVVKAKKTQGCSSYSGTQKNDISTGKWGSYGDSFYFPDKGDGKCDDERGVAGTCKGNFKAMDKDSFTCTCESDQITGSVWGTDIYTSDSSICAAARHAGVIKESGGEVKAKKTQGCSSYNGTERNGISTGKWGSYGDSFYFPEKGDGECAK